MTSTFCCHLDIYVIYKIECRSIYISCRSNSITFTHSITYMLKLLIDIGRTWRMKLYPKWNCPTPNFTSLSFICNINCKI